MTHETEARPRVAKGSASALQHRVLVIAEDEFVRRLLRQLLASQGLQTIQRGYESGALETLERTAPDLVLFDLVGPSPLELCALQRLQTCCAPHSIPVIAVLSTREKSAIACARDAGANDYVSWPFDWMTWWPCIRAHLFGVRAEASTGGGGGADPDEVINALSDAYLRSPRASFGRRVNMRI